MSFVNYIRDSLIIQAIYYEASYSVISEDDGTLEFAFEWSTFGKMMTKYFPQIAHGIFTVGSVKLIHLVDVVGKHMWRC